MFDEGEKIFYINTQDGSICSARFIESTDDGVWISIAGNTINTFIYKDNTKISLYRDLKDAEIGLQDYKNSLKAKLLKDDLFISDILTRLARSEGKLYVSIIEEILNELK